MNVYEAATIICRRLCNIRVLKEPRFQLTLCDEGCGISNLDNVFVPFYSTKKHGTGIGLVLCRQIIEAHDGRITITNQTNAPGCCVRVELPLRRE